MASKVTKSSPLLAAMLRSLVRGLSRLSLAAARRLGKVLGALLWIVPNQFRENSFRNVERCFPEIAEDERRRIVHQSLVSTGLTVAEAGIMFHSPLERLVGLAGNINGRQLVTGAIGEGRAVILLAPHVGNWEYLSHWLTQVHPIMCLYRRPRIKELDSYLRGARERFGSEFVPASPGGIRRMVKALATGGVVGILPDQEPLKKHGVFAPFFGIPALTMTLVGTLARRFDPLVVYGVAARNAVGKFDIHIRPAPDELYDPDPVRAATALNAGVEEIARQFSEQYIWSYRRFRTRPPAELAARDSLKSPVRQTTPAG